jgi:transposase
MTRQGGEKLMQITIGIDISKDMLDAYRLSDSQHIRVANDKAGHKTLIQWIQYNDNPLVIFEATGAYHRKVEAALAASNIAFAKVNPRQARRFAEASGRLAKTDRVDAAMLAKMGAVLELKQQKPKSEILHILRELLTARRALMKDKVAAKTRLQTTTQPLLKKQINARLKQIALQIQQLDAAIADNVAQDQELSFKLAILTSIPGIAETSAFSILIEMPELGTLDGKQVASLAGLAPMSRQSGKWQGKERIQGGRTFLRRAIYMPALVATRYNPDLKAKYDQLIRAGKPGKVAITAIMRKLIVMANALLRDGRKWSEIMP